MSDVKSPAPQIKYQYRYGEGTASDVALDLLDRVKLRVSFLEKMFKGYQETGVTIPDYDVLGLGYILEDIAEDTETAYGYFCGENPSPGIVCRFKTCPAAQS